MKVGDRVIAIQNHDIPIKGLMGTVIGEEIDDWDDPYVTVEFDDHINGHNANGKGKINQCWNIPLSKLELIDEKPIKIRWYKKGKLEESVKSGEFEVGDIVYCLHNRNDKGGKMSLTVGKGYEIEYVDKGIGNYIHILTDANDIGRYSMKFFTLTPIDKDYLIDYLKKQEEERLKHKDVDPYCEEDWD